MKLTPIAALALTSLQPACSSPLWPSGGERCAALVAWAIAQQCPRTQGAPMPKDRQPVGFVRYSGAVTLPRPPRVALLGELEQAVMEHLWSCGCGDVTDVQSHVGEARGIRSNTVQSTLKRLYGKGLLTRRKLRHAFVYEPTCSRAQWQRNTLDQVVNSVMDGETDAMLAAFVDLTERAGPEQLERLQRLVTQRRTDS